ncbi:hypothetical protein JR334_06580 [Clostridia bacterium]|nr:hypothetical protein JR334_06580 [Clostridia bacterium]
MKVSTNAIVSNSEMIRNYKRCRDKAEELGKIFIMKNNQLDAILFSFAEYERLADIIEYLEGLEEFDFMKVLESLPEKGRKKNYTMQNRIPNSE